MPLSAGRESPDRDSSNSTCVHGFCAVEWVFEPKKVEIVKIIVKIVRKGRNYKSNVFQVQTRGADRLYIFRD